MFKLVYVKSVLKDLKRIAPNNLSKIKSGIEELVNLPNIRHSKHLTNHSIADHRLRIGNYYVPFDVDWQKKEIHILKIAQRREIY